MTRVIIFNLFVMLLWYCQSDAFILGLSSRSSRHVLSLKETSQESTVSSWPKALLHGYVPAEDLPDVIAALQRFGFDTNSLGNHDREKDEDNIYIYKLVKASGMLQLQQAPSRKKNEQPTQFPAPRYIPLIADEEHVLVQNGWSFLDPDESEPLSAYDVDAANREGQYIPQWGEKTNDDDENHGTEGRHDNSISTKTALSELGYDLNTWSEEQILEKVTHSNNQLSRHVLLEGGTDPPGQKVTNNGVDFSGSVNAVPEGIFVCALGGLPLFAASDLAASTTTSGWLSFARPLSDDHVSLILPESTTTPSAATSSSAFSSSVLDRRIEVVCGRTKCHLGHYFGPQEGYCINASALNFIPKEDKLNYAALLQGSLPCSFLSLEENRQISSANNLLVQMITDGATTQKIWLGAGCFWHVEFALRRLPGVVSTQVGYAGGKTTGPVSYEQVCHGDTGHAEIVEVEFAPAVLSSRILVDCFLSMHDPTKTRAHGKHALGTGQYRSCILVCDKEMQSVAQEALIDCQTQLGKDLSTELYLQSSRTGTDWFHPAEERHQRHDEKRKVKVAGDSVEDDLSTLDIAAWLTLYGKRKASVLGSSETL